MRISPRISNESCTGGFAAGTDEDGTFEATRELLVPGVCPWSERPTARVRRVR